MPRGTEDHLYDAQGRFLFYGKHKGKCLACGARGRIFDVGALGPNYFFCRRCIVTEGPKNLRREANRALAAAGQKVDALRGAVKEMERRYREKFGADLVLHLRKI